MPEKRGANQKKFRKIFRGRPRLELTPTAKGGNMSQNRVIHTKDDVPATNEAWEETTMG